MAENNSWSSRIATSPSHWGIEDDETQWPAAAKVLEEMARAGFRATELGQRGFLPEDPHELTRTLAGHGITTVGGHVMEPWEDAASRRRIIADVETRCRLLHAVGGTTLVVIDDFVPGRSQTAGRSEAATRLDDTRWRVLTDVLGEVADIATRHGLRAAFHPHAGTYVEFEDEVERLLADTAGTALDLCIDTGHCAYAGIDPVALLERHQDRVSHLHLKDVDAAKLVEATAGEMPFFDAVGLGVFCRLGDGMVDLPGLIDRLVRAGYPGWLTIEHDRVLHNQSAAYDDARSNFSYIKELADAVVVMPIDVSSAQSAAGRGR